MIDFAAGAGAMLAVLAGVFGGAGYYVAKHPQIIMKKIMKSAMKPIKPR